MGKKLVLAEKPSVGREIAKILNCNQKGNGCFIGSGYVVTWALGHLVTLADPEKYNDKYKVWKAEDLPMMPPRMDLVVMRETSKQYGIVSGLMKQQDIDELIIATDAGREGELVARWIMLKAGWKKPVRRLWISSQTERAIKDGFKNLKPGRDYENLFASAECRAEADWLVGLNVTRALTCHFNAQLSAGRVQTPTLAMIVERENEIRSFVPKDYWSIEGKAKGFTLRWVDKSGQGRIFDRDKAEAIVKKLTGQTAEVIEVKKEIKKDLPPLAYDLTELQRDANRKYGFSAKTTSSVMQRLYEEHKIVTYPRTDSRYISDDIVPTLPERLQSVAYGEYAVLAKELLRGKLNPGKRLVDNSKVTDHHAIIPTEETADWHRLGSEEAKVYDLIVKRFLAVLMPPYEYEQTSIRASAGGEIFTASGRVVRQLGWKKVYGAMNDMDEEASDDEKGQELPPLSKNDKLPLAAVRTVAGKTKPTARYTEATLLSAMEHPGKFIDDRELRASMEGGSGLGTPATRADIIEKLFNSFYVERKGKEIYPTSKGIQLIGLVPPEMRSPELTARWEQSLAEISRGKGKKIEFMNGIRQHTVALVKAVLGSDQAYRHDNLTREKCPECGKYLLQVKGKKGEHLVCPDRDCGFRRNKTVVSNARCPECHKKMEMRGEGDGKLFVCSCGFRESMSSFKKRREDRDDQGKKGEVARFLKDQKDGPMINTALADALAKLKK